MVRITQEKQFISFISIVVPYSVIPVRDTVLPITELLSLTVSWDWFLGEPVGYWKV